MATSQPTTAPRTRSLRMALAILLLIAALLAHVFSAHAIGGYFIAYRDHIAGFFIIAIVTGGLIAGLGWRYWRGRRDLMWLVIGAVQAIIGFIIWLNRFHIG